MEEQMTVIFRVLGASDWEETLRTGIVPPCGSDTRDGFIHLSAHGDVLQTANLYFVPDEEPLVLEVQTSHLGTNLRWEPVPSRDNKEFPHLYAPGIPLDAVLATHSLDHQKDGFHWGIRYQR